MIRSHESMPWYCCGVMWPKEYRHCGFCGMAVMTADRVLLRFPLRNGGSIAVVANGEPDAASWEFLAQSVALTAASFAAHEAKKAAEQTATDSPAGAPVPAVDPSWSSPDALTTPELPR